MARSFSRNQLPVRAASSLSLVRISKGRWKRRWSSSCHCSARLPGQTTRQRLQVAARDQLLDEQPGHDRLAGAGIVGEQEAQRLARQHRLVDRGDLVRQRIHERGVDREHRIEEVREADAVRLGDEAEERAVAVEAPRAARLDDLEARLVVAVEDLVGDAAVRVRGRRASARPSRATATLTTVTAASGRMPRTVASGWRSSRVTLNKCPLPPADRKKTGQRGCAESGRGYRRGDSNMRGEADGGPLRGWLSFPGHPGDEHNGIRSHDDNAMGVGYFATLEAP